MQPLTLQDVEQAPVRDREAEPAWGPIVVAVVLTGRVGNAAIRVVGPAAEALPGRVGDAAVRVVRPVFRVRGIQR